MGRRISHAPPPRLCPGPDPHAVTLPAQLQQPIDCGRISERKALVWIGMDYSAGRDPAFDPAIQLLPGRVVLLAAPPEHS